MLTLFIDRPIFKVSTKNSAAMPSSSFLRNCVNYISAKRLFKIKSIINNHLVSFILNKYFQSDKEPSINGCNTTIKSARLGVWISINCLVFDNYELIILSLNKIFSWIDLTKLFKFTVFSTKELHVYKKKKKQNRCQISFIQQAKKCIRTF